MNARGLMPGSQLIHFIIIPATIQIATQLSIEENGPVYEIKRIRLADGVPMALETNHISANLIKGLTEPIVNQSLYAHIEGQLNLRIGSASQVIESAIASQIEAKYLKIHKGAAVMHIQQNTYLKDGTPVEYVKSAYRADRYKFLIGIKR